MTLLYSTEDEARPQRRNRSRRRRNRGNRTDGSISGDRQPGQLIYRIGAFQELR